MRILIMGTGYGGMGRGFRDTGIGAGLATRNATNEGQNMTNSEDAVGEQRQGPGPYPAGVRVGSVSA